MAIVVEVSVHAVVAVMVLTNQEYQMRRFAVALLCLLPVVAEAAPPQELPAKVQSRAARAEKFSWIEDLLTQILKKHVDLVYIRVFTEQNGEQSNCYLAIVDGAEYRVAAPAFFEKAVHQPTDQQWIDAGCERPNFAFIG